MNVINVCKIERRNSPESCVHGRSFHKTNTDVHLSPPRNAIPRNGFQLGQAQPFPRAIFALCFLGLV